MINIKEVMIVTEGISDKQFLEALTKYLELYNIGVENAEGKSNIKIVIDNILTESFDIEVKRIVIICDADNDLELEIEYIKELFKDLGLNIPTQPKQITKPKSITIEQKSFNVSSAFYLLPDNINKGELEDLLFQSLRTEVKECIENYIECIKEKAKFQIKGKVSKAKLSFYLATTSEKHYKKLNKSIKFKDIFDFENKFDDLKSFLINISNLKS